MTLMRNVLKFGSRNREISVENDNQGFANWAIKQDNLLEMSKNNPALSFFGEWLVPHSLKTYREVAWRNLYVFDVWDSEQEKYLHYNDYKDILEEYSVEYIAPLRIVNNPQQSRLLDYIEENTYLIEDGKGFGEGLVLKNYSFVNKFGHQKWGKIVTNEFREKHSKNQPTVVSHGDFIEQKIVEEFLDEDIIKKVYAKITAENDGWSSKYIGRLLGTVWHDFVVETTWDILKKHKNPKIDYSLLNRFAIMRVKKVMPELF